uniref:Uncharacterized protein n=1 Tax=Dulem virus 40 TaxID=3145758 RepID=A0AAU8AUT2_9CAUD
MEKEQILSTLNEQLGKTSLSARTISDYVTNNLPEEGAEFDFDRHVKILKSLNGNFSADVAAQVEDFKKNYKPSPSTTETQQKGGDPDLLKRIEQLEGKLAESAKNASTSTLRAEATAKGKSLKVANEAIWEDAVKVVQIGDNDSADDVTDKAKKEYERLLKRYYGEGTAPYGNSGRQGASKEAEEQAKGKRENLKKKMQNIGRLPKSE